MKRQKIKKLIAEYNRLRHIAKKPIKEEISLRMTMPPMPLTRYRCPVCEKVVWDLPGGGYTKPNYCEYCGTKLDWSEYD